MAAAAPQTPNPDPSVFEYPPLPEGVDAIRVLTVEPGGFADHVVCGLVPVAFSAKPRYTALSYTWQDPYPHWENESEKTLPPSPAAIVLNGRPFAVQPNLFLALVHLRSPKHALALWVDAVCINQADPEERDCQVAIMSFIYTRALLVAVWLGPKVHGAQTDQLRRMHTDWKMGEARLLAASIHDTDKQLLHYSAEPDAATADRIAASAYWTRLWIVQELCLPQRLVFVYGAVLWRYEDLARWDVVREARNADPSGTCAKTQHSSVGAGLAAIVQLIATRDARHSDRLRLERLVERFARSRCSELRDRVYSLLGLATDVYTFPRERDERESDSRGQLPARRGSGYFPVRYACALYELWVDVVRFAYFGARAIDAAEWCTPAFLLKLPTTSLDVDKTRSYKQQWIDERRVSVVRTAGVVQAALDQRVADEEPTPPSSSSSSPSDSDSDSESQSAGSTGGVIRAYGYLAGRIVQMGPAYGAWVGSFRAHQDWVGAWEDHAGYDTPPQLERLHRIHDRYAARLMAYGAADLARVAVMRRSGVVAWKLDRTHQVDPDGKPRFDADDGGENGDGYRAVFDRTWGSEAPDMKARVGNILGKGMSKLPPSQDDDEPRLFLGTGCAIGLVPALAQVGDCIVRFWNCDAAILMRPVAAPKDDADASAPATAKAQDLSPAPPTAFMLLGRADVAEVVDRTATPGFDPHAEQMLRGGTPDDGTADLGAVCVDLDLLTLQKITAHINT